MKYYFSASLKTLSLFAILPIASHFLPKEEVGRFFFWIAVVQLGAGITTLGFSSAVSRRAYNRRVIDYVAGTGLLASVIAWIIVMVVGQILGWVSLVVLIAWIARSSSMIGEARAIARSEISTLSNAYAAYAFVFPGIGLAAVSFFEATHHALLIAFSASESVIALSGLWRLRLRIRSDFRVVAPRFARSVASSAGYGLPIMIAGIANMGLNSTDRFIVTGFHGYEAVAEFSIMYTVAFASSRFITAPANMKIFPEFIRGHASADVLHQIGRAAGFAFVISALYCALITATGPLIVRFVLGAQYDLTRADFALVSAASSMFLVFTINSSHLKLQRRTVTFMIILFLALVMSVGVSLLLVPKLGYRGASISTLLTYSCLAAWALVRLRPILFDRLTMFVGATVLVVTLGAALAR